MLNSLCSMEKAYGTQSVNDYRQMFLIPSSPSGPTKINH